jgi:septal ring factor EnvC (AmiA/AmiB activator)
MACCLHRRLAGILATALLLSSLGCAATRSTTAASAPSDLAIARAEAAAPPAIAETAALAAAQSAAAPAVPSHPVPADLATSGPIARRDTSRQYPIAVPPMRTYGCCH